MVLKGGVFHFGLKQWVFLRLMNYSLRFSFG
jgi:hypothetical protein